MCTSGLLPEGVLPYFGYLRMCDSCGWVCEKVCTYDGCFLSIPAPIMGTFLEILSSLGAQNGHFPSKWPNFFAHYRWVLSKFCTYDWCFFCDLLRTVFKLGGRTSIAISRASTLPSLELADWSYTLTLYGSHSLIHTFRHIHRGPHGAHYLTNTVW